MTTPELLALIDAVVATCTTCGTDLRTIPGDGRKFCPNGHMQRPTSG